MNLEAELYLITSALKNYGIKSHEIFPLTRKPFKHDSDLQMALVSNYRYPITKSY